jgi:hypothetical protein
MSGPKAVWTDVELAEQIRDVRARTSFGAKLMFHDFEEMLAHPGSHADGRACPSIVDRAAYSSRCRQGRDALSDADR